LIANIINAISDNNALVLFKAIAIGSYQTDALISKVKLTKKQYYMRLSRLMKVGLIKRKKGRYILTSLGKVVFYCEKLMETALTDYYWKFKVIDVIETDDKIQMEDCAKVIDKLIDNKEIKDIILSEKKEVTHLTHSSKYML
jgi:predicted transcriptional regulator